MLAVCALCAAFTIAVVRLVGDEGAGLVLVLAFAWIGVFGACMDSHAA